MENRREKTLKQQQEDAAFYKIILWMAGAVILEGLLLLVNRYYIDYYVDEADLAVALSVALRVVAVAGIVAAALCAVWAVRRGKSGKHTVVPWALAVFCAALAVCGGGSWLFYATGVQLLCALVPAAAVLAIIYYLYQWEFFTVALVSGLGLLGVWTLTRNAAVGWKDYVLLALIAVVIAAAAVLTRVLQNKQGLFTVKGKEHQVLLPGANYALLYVSCALMAAVLIAALLLGGAVTAMVFYAVPVAWVFIMAVYYTVKLM